MASTKIIITTVPKSDQVKAFNMLPASRKAQILQQMAAATDAQLGLQTSNKCKAEMPDSNPAPRKRQRLTHLTTEEKMMRRKLKNRVAAQTARDRKKAQFDDLEATLTVMEARNKQLLIENALLKKQNESLLEENRELKERLQGSKDENQSVVVLDHGYCMDSTPSPISTQPTMKKEVDVESPESAAGVGSTPPRLPVDDADVESEDELLGLLGHLNQAAVSGTFRLLSSEGEDEQQGGGALVPGNTGDQQPEQQELVGPTAAELESIKELIQFDHEYLKPVIDVQTKSPVNGSSLVANASLTQDIAEMIDTGITSNCITQIGDMSTVQSFKTEGEDEMDLLLGMGTNRSTFDEFGTVNPLTSDTPLTGDLKELMGLISSTKDYDSHSLSGKSDYGSGSDSGISDDPRSPFSDEGGPLSSPGLGDSLWEESFTDLFPSLDL